MTGSTKFSNKSVSLLVTIFFEETYSNNNLIEVLFSFSSKISLRSSSFAISILSLSSSI